MGKEQNTKRQPSEAASKQDGIEEKADLLSRARGVWGPLTAISGILATIIATVLGTIAWFDAKLKSAVEKALSDELVVRKIAAEAHPSLIFDVRGTVLYDSGALKYISEIRPHGTNTNIIAGFTIRPKQLLPMAPLVTSLDLVVLESRIERGLGLDWEFTVTNSYSMSVNSDESRSRFRLEVLR